MQCPDPFSSIPLLVSSDPEQYCSPLNLTERSDRSKANKGMLVIGKSFERWANFLTARPSERPRRAPPDDPVEVVGHLHNQPDRLWIVNRRQFTDGTDPYKRIAICQSRWFMEDIDHYPILFLEPIRKVAFLW
jgi:hypothetical protein